MLLEVPMEVRSQPVVLVMWGEVPMVDTSLEVPEEVEMQVPGGLTAEVIQTPAALPMVVVEVLDTMVEEVDGMMMLLLQVEQVDQVSLHLLHTALRLLQVQEVLRVILQMTITQVTLVGEV
jgi:hypothetical protein